MCYWWCKFQVSILLTHSEHYCVVPNVGSIYEECTQQNNDGDNFSISATDVNIFYQSPFALFCKYHVSPAKQDPPDAFVYVNGSLFGDAISIPTFTTESRNLILEADSYDWSKVNPAIFGSMFQVILDKKQRRHAGAHYTTEENIMRVIEPLFLDNLKQELEDAKSVLDARATHPTSTPYDLYNPITMPPNLLKAHRKLDKTVDRLYRKETFGSDDERTNFLFEKYEKMTSSVR